MHHCVSPVPCGCGLQVYAPKLTTLSHPGESLLLINQQYSDIYIFPALFGSTRQPCWLTVMVTCYVGSHCWSAIAKDTNVPYAASSWQRWPNGIIIYLYVRTWIAWMCWRIHPRASVSVGWKGKINAQSCKNILKWQLKHLTLLEINIADSLNPLWHHQTWTLMRIRM